MSSRLSSRHIQTLSDLLRRRNKRFQISIVASVAVLFIILQSVVLFLEHQSTQTQIATWLGKNKTRIEQALFLQNTLAVGGIIDEFTTLTDQIRGVRVVQFNGEVANSKGTMRGCRELNNSNGFQTNFPYGLLCYRAPLTFADRNYGYIEIAAHYNLQSLLLNTFLCVLMSVLLLIIVRKSASALIGELERTVVEPLSKVAETMRTHPTEVSELSSISRSPMNLTSAPQEIIDLIDSYDGLVDIVKSLSAKDRQRIELLAYSKIARQVSHDIRSPLTALTFAAYDLPGLADDKRTLIRLAIQRINDISHSLLEQKRLLPPTVRLESISEIIETLLVEKRAEYSSKPELQFQAHLELAYDAFVSIDAATLKRHISNLVNNAAESMALNGTVMLRAAKKESEIIVTIEDTGSGIPDFILRDLGQRPISYGKDGSRGGQGIGVLHAKEYFDSIGGNLNIKSVACSGVGSGTTMTIALKSEEPPRWFLAALKLRQNSLLVLVDDDPSVHAAWKMRIAELGQESKQIRIQSFFDPASFKKWISENPDEAASALYLMDHEFSGCEDSGLDLIEHSLSLQHNAVLVTSHADEDVIQKRVLARGLRLLPKNLAPHVPLTIQ